MAPATVFISVPAPHRNGELNNAIEYPLRFGYPNHYETNSISHSLLFSCASGGARNSAVKDRAILNHFLRPGRDANMIAA